MSWPVTTIDDIKSRERYSCVGGPFGSDLTGRDYVSEGVPVIRGSNLPADVDFLDDGFVFVSAEKAAALRANTAAPGDLVFTQRGTLGQVGLIPLSARFPEYVISQSQMKLRVDPSRVDPRFLYYFFRHPNTVQQVISRAITSGVPHINLSILKAFCVPCPPLRDQLRVVSVLASFDSLIANNRRRMALLEQAARLIYEEWFVRLRFPGHEGVRVVDGVPEGWAHTELGAICDDHRDAVDPAELDPETPYIGLEHMPRRSIALADWGRADAVTSTKLRYCEGDVLFGKIRPYFHKVGVAFNDGVTSSDTIVLRANRPEFAALVLMTASSDAFVAATAQGMKEGTKMPRADVKQMMAYPVLLPSARLLAEFSRAIMAITQQLRILSFQARKLEQARDLLLPRLMSGEVIA